MSKKCLIVLMLILGLFAGCEQAGVEVPEIESPEKETVETSVESTGTNGTVQIETLTVALPYSEETVEYLVKMYQLKKDGLWDEDMDGQTVSLTELDKAEIDFVLDIVQTSTDGAGEDTLASWEEGGVMPDLFFAGDIEVAKDYAAELNDSIAKYSGLNNEDIYINTLYECAEDGIYYGIPHCMSAEVLIGTTDYIPEAGKPGIKYTAEELTEYLQDISEEYEGVTPFAMASDMLPYLGSCFNEDEATSYMLQDEYKNDKEKAEKIFEDELEFVRKLYSEGLSADTDESGANPVYVRTAALWVGSSASLDMWKNYYPSRLYTLGFPCASVSDTAIYMVHVYPLCVYKESESKDLASDFAMFLSTDEDAQLLIYRCESRTGFFPAVRTDSVWDAVYGDEVFGLTAYVIRQVLGDCVFVGAGYGDAAEYLANFDPDAEYSLEGLYGS